MQRTRWNDKLCPIPVLMLEGETAATHLYFSICGGCAAGKRLWHSKTESLGGPAHVLYTVRRIPRNGLVVCSVCLPSSQPHCTVARSLIHVCVRTDFVRLNISRSDTPCGFAEYSE